MNKAAEDIPLISVCILTYNHEKFISQCLDSVLAQQVDCSFEVCISDDASQDGTPDIISAYQAKYPQIINANLNTINTGLFENRNYAMLACRGKYIATIEGDDYWTDNNKLGKQLRIMEDNPGVAFCFTNSWLFSDINPNAKTEICGKFPLNKDYVFDLEEYLEMGYHIPAVTKMLRRSAFPEDGLPPWCRNMIKLDWITHLLNFRHGNAYYLNEITAAYRRHDGGMLQSSGYEKIAATSAFALTQLPVYFDKRLEKYFRKMAANNFAYLLHEYWIHKEYNKFFRTSFQYFNAPLPVTLFFKLKILAGILQASVKAKAKLLMMNGR